MNPSLRGLSSPGGVTFEILTIVFLILSILAAALRIWAKNVLRRDFRAHDHLIFLALVFAIGFAVITLLSISPGAVGLHIQDVLRGLDPDALTITLKAFFASAFIWITATTLIKASILHLYIVLFRQPRFLHAAYVMALLCGLYWIAYILTGFLVCRPIAFNWNKSLKGHCGNITSQEVGSATINMILDLLIVILPLPVLWTLQMPRRKKVMLTGLFSLGLCICAVNITRVVLEITQDPADATYSFLFAGLFAGLEIYIGIITACLPVFGPVILRERVCLGGKHRKNNSVKDRPRLNGPLRGHMNNGVYEGGAFERLGDDEIPLREISVQGGVSDQTSARVDPHTFRPAVQFADGNGAPNSTVVKTNLQGLDSLV